MDDGAIPNNERTQVSLKLRYDLFGAEVLGEARFTGKYEFPVIPGIKLDAVPGRFVPFDRAGTDLREGDWLHGYVHDKRFHRFLADADRQFKRIEKAAGYIGADNSVYRDLPLAEQIHSCYLNRAIDYFIWSKGKKVVQNVSWGDWRSYEFCFDGIPRESTVAMSTYGCSKTAAKRFSFEEGFVASVKRLKPYSILLHGPIWNSLDGLAASLDVRLLRIQPWREMVDAGNAGKEDC